MRSRLLYTGFIAILLLVTAGIPARAETGSSTAYRLEMQQNVVQGTSSSYDACLKQSAFSLHGSSGSYQLLPGITCPPSTAATLCGNGIIESGEQCDSGNLDGNSCSTLGFDSGTLACNSTCQFTGCFNAPAVSIPGGRPFAPPSPPSQPSPVPPVIPSTSYTVETHKPVKQPEPPTPPASLIPAQIIQPVRIQQPTPTTSATASATPSTTTSKPLITNDPASLNFFSLEYTESLELILHRDHKELHNITLTSPIGITSTVQERVYADETHQETIRRHISVAIDSERTIPPPTITQFDGIEYGEHQQDFSNYYLHTINRSPGFRGKTHEPATIWILDVNRDVITVLQTDENNEFYFLPRTLGFQTQEFRIVALYEQEDVNLLSHEIKIPFTVLPQQICASCIIVNVIFPDIVCWLLLALAVIAVMLAMLYCHYRRRGSRKARSKSPASPARKMWKFFLIALFATMTLQSGTAEAANTTPLFTAYSGILRDNNGSPITTARQFRFSLWKSADFSSAADLTGGGGINTAAANFAGWQEEQIITPDSSGFFTVHIGAVTLDPWPNFTASEHRFMQVEIKAPAEANTLYQLIDPDGIDNTADRFAIGSEPFARNADYLDNREIGTSAGDIAILGVGGVWDVSLMPTGTNADIWQIDANDNAPGGIIQLSFGSALSNHILSWNPNGAGSGDGWFNFSDDLNVEGNLTVTGSITGAIDFSNLTPRNKSDRFAPHYPGATLQALGAGDHKGKVETFFVDTNALGPNNFNYYQWTTRQSTLQNMDLILKYRLPDDFVSWQTIPVVLRYKTEDNTLTNNRIDVAIDDATGAPITTLSGNTALAGSSWTTVDITFSSGTFSPGEEITVYIKMSALDIGAAYVSDITFHYTGR